MVIGRLRSDDIYNQVRCYPNPEHRWAALAEQASMLYICLYFAPDILKTETATMREIADKFFPDNWVISVYMGITVNLVEWWEPYKAARTALQNTTQLNSVKQIGIKYDAKIQVNSHIFFRENVETILFQKLLVDTAKLLHEGALTEENILDSTVKVLNVVRECNVTLRWMMLHTTPLKPGAEQIKRCRQLRDQVVASDPRAAKQQSNKQKDLFKLLLRTSQFEFKLRTMYKRMINRRRISWEKCRENAREKMMELVKLIEADAKTTKSKSEKLKEWFIARESQMAQLSLDGKMLLS